MVFVLTMADDDAVVAHVLLQLQAMPLAPAVVSQQRGESAPSLEAQAAVLHAELASHPARFLRRWGMYLQPEHLGLFALVDNLEVQHLVRELSISPRARHTRTRNRRYVRMQQLMAEGSYFSEEEMKIRAPWLYDQFVGKYETDSEIKQRIDDITRGTWSGQLMQHAASAAASDRMAQEQRDALQRLGLTEQDMRDVLDEAEAEAEEEARGGARRPGDDDENDGEEFDSDEDDAMQGRSQRPAAPARPDDNLSSEQRLRRTAARTALGLELDSSREQARKDISAEERLRLRDEFLSLMMARFLRGDDAEFVDYADIDASAELDDSEQADRDAEEAYFDAD